MRNQKKYRAVVCSVCTSLVMSGVLLGPMNGLVVKAEESVPVMANITQDASDLLTSSIVFRKDGVDFSQPFVNFIPTGQTVLTGLDGYSSVMTNPEILNQYIQTINDMLAGELYQESAIDMQTEDTGIYHHKVYAYQFGDEARKCLEEQLAYHAIGAMSGDVIIDMKEVPLTKLDISVEEKGAAVTLLGAYETSYATSSASRCTNVELAAANFDGTVAAPGEIVSCSTLFKQRTIENGYKVAGIFINGEKGEGIGGGVCQVSSTVYAAALKAGLGIVERHAHSLPVAYIPTGMDATISYPVLDLRIQNNKDIPVMFKATTQNKKVKIEIFGVIDAQ